MQRKKTVGNYTIYLHCFDGEYDIRIYYYFINGNREKTNQFIFSCAIEALKFFDVF